MTPLISHKPRTEQEYHTLLELLVGKGESVTGVGLAWSQLSQIQNPRRLRPRFVAVPQPSLGEALLGSTSVVYLGLAIFDLLYYELGNEQDTTRVMDHFAPLIEYIRTNATLRNLGLNFTCNTRASNLPLEINLSDRIAQAVAENSNINEFRCSVRPHRLSLPLHILTMAPHVTNLNLSFTNESFDSHQDKVIITKAFLTNRSLKELKFSWKAGGEAMVNVLLLVIPLSNFHLTTLTLSPPATRPFSSPKMAHVFALEHFLATTTKANRPLLHLRLGGYHFKGATATRLFSALGVSSCQIFGFPSGTMDEEATNAFVLFVNGLVNA